MSIFAKAVKHESKLRLAITGPSGSGKTYTSLAIAVALAGGKPVAVVDTEHGSASKYADLFTFDVVNMEAPFHPDRFVEMIREAAKAGYAVIVLDSLTHAWQGTGGMLDLVDEIAKRKTSGNGFAAWKDATPIQNRLVESIVGAPVHVIATMRSKQDYVQDKDDRGKTQIRKVGMAAQQREGFEYEFDVVMDMDIDNNGIVSKTRCPALTGRVFGKPGRDVANILAEWLRGEPATQPSTQSKEAQPQSAPPAVTVTTTGNGGAGNGNGRKAAPNAFGIVPAARWPDAAAAYAWAVESGACENTHEARASLKKIVDAQFDGRLTGDNVAAAFDAFHARQLEKLHEKAEAAVQDAPELDPDALEVPA